GGKSSHKETVQRIFVVTPHIVDLDAESLARLQATRLRDISIGEEIQKDAEEDEAEKERRRREEQEPVEDLEPLVALPNELPSDLPAELSDDLPDDPTVQRSNGSTVQR
ncbi:MAG: hypothetical protein IJ783_06355, partial [Kiritimatiellae bacterium]|nr:hypothetical protein [Kiritimatiellia bacterium]